MWKMGASVAFAGVQRYWQIRRWENGKSAVHCALDLLTLRIQQDHTITCSYELRIKVDWASLYVRVS